MRGAAIALILILCGSGAAVAAPTPSMKLASSASGVTLGGTTNAATMNLGNGNGLAVGTATSGVSRVGLATGPLYSSPFSISLTGWGNNPSLTVTAYLSANFAHGSGTSPQLRAMYCVASDCTSAANQLALSTSPIAPSTLRSAAGNGSFTVSVGALIAYLNGSSAFTGTEMATIVLTASDANDIAHTDLATLTITSTVQQAVSFTLDTATAVSVTDGTTTSYLVDFGTVDAFGVSTGNGATRSVTGTGTLYSTIYLIRPAFSSMTASAATVRMFVSSNFAHTGLLQLQDSSTGTSNNFAAISTNAAAGSQTVVTSSAQSKLDITRHLGLFVSHLNGANAFVGADSAVITYTLIVP
jgi:hypothetical protein